MFSRFSRFLLILLGVLVGFPGCLSNCYVFCGFFKVFCLFVSFSMDFLKSKMGWSSQ